MTEGHLNINMTSVCVTSTDEDNDVVGLSVNRRSDTVAKPFRKTVVGTGFTSFIGIGPISEGLCFVLSLLFVVVLL